MEKGFKGRIDKIKILQKRLRLNSEQLAILVEPPMDARELDLILGKDDSIYRDEDTVKAIEKAIKKAVEISGANIE